MMSVQALVRLFFLLIFFSGIASAYGQELTLVQQRRADSLMTELQKREGTQDTLIFDIYLSLSGIVESFNIDSSVTLLQKANRVGPTSYRDEFDLYMMMSQRQYSKFNFKEAIETYNKAVDIAKKAGNDIDRAVALQKIAAMYVISELGNEKILLGYIDEAIALFSKKKAFEKLAMALSYKAGYYLVNKQDYVKAFPLINRFSAICDSIGSVSGLAIGNYYLGIYYEDYTQNNESALGYYQKADSLDRILGNNQGAARAQIPRVLDKLGRTQEAIDFLENYYTEQLNLGAAQSLTYVLKSLASFYAKQGDFENAYHYEQQYVYVQDSLYTSEKLSAIKKLEKDFELKQKEDRNKILTQEKVLAESKLKRERLFTGASFIGLVLFIVLGIFLFQNVRRHKSKNMALEEKNEQILLQKEELSSQSDELKLSNEKLRELDSFKQRMMSMIVHDFKNPLNQIINQSQKPSVRSSGVRLLNMTQTFLDVHRFRDTSLSINKSSGRVSALCEKAVFHFEHFFTEKNISLERKVPENLSASLDFELCLRTLENLLSNALKFTPVGGTIRLTAKAEVDDLIIKVEDSGPGISEEKRTLIFKDFYQDEAKNLGLTGSSGLGLAFCQMAVKAHDGTIGVFESDKLGGAAFSLRFPKATETSTAPVLSEDSPEPEEINSIPSYAFSETDLQKLRAFAEELQDTDFFMVTEIMEKASAILDKESDLQMQWLRDFEGSLLAGDEKRSKQILTAIL